MLAFLAISLALLSRGNSSEEYLQVQGLTREQVGDIGISLLPPTGSPRVSRRSAEQEAVTLCPGSVRQSTLANSINLRGPHYRLVWLVIVDSAGDCRAHPICSFDGLGVCPADSPQMAAVLVDAGSGQESTEPRVYEDLLFDAADDDAHLFPTELTDTSPPH